MKKEGLHRQAGLTRRNLLAVLAGLAAFGAGSLILGPRADGEFNLKSWPVRTVEIKNFTFNPETATVIWREYKE